MKSPYMRRTVERWSYGFFKKGGGKKIGSLFFFCLLLWFCYVYFCVFQPSLLRLGSAHATRLAQEVIHSAVASVMEREEWKEVSLVSLEMSPDGQIAAVLPDSVLINQLKSSLALEITSRLEERNAVTVSLPLGSLTGVEVFSGMGPRLEIEMMPYGRAVVDIESHFCDAGINQTRHQMIAKVEAEVSLLLPDYRSCSAGVEAAVPLCETVVVGAVPNSYTNLETTEETLREDVLNLLN